jgi:hypothetical protein
MKKFLPFTLALSLMAASAMAQPLIDGAISPGEYPSSKKLMGGDATLYWAWDAQGGLSIAFTMKNTGWLAVGLGSGYMSRSLMLIGEIDSAGKQVFAQQLGKGHSHYDAGSQTADKLYIAATGGVETLEFHVPAGKLKKAGKSLPFIVAYSTRADLTAIHDDYDMGSIPLP